MTLNERMSEIFERGLRDGVGTLSPSDRELFRIQDFVIEYEMGGLSGYFYNRISDPDSITAAVAAMRQHGLSELASLLHEALGLFADYQGDDRAIAWGDALEKLSAGGPLLALDQKVAALNNYGLEQASPADPSKGSR